MQTSASFSSLVLSQSEILLTITLAKAAVALGLPAFIP